MSKESIKEIGSRLKMAEDAEREQLMKVYASDDRAGVQKLLEKYRKQKEKLLAEKERLAKMRQYEEKYADYAFICGIDEVGRGPLAGPVVAGAVILPKECEILYINDSKKLSAVKRDELYDEIMDKAVAVGLGMASPARIDEINILQATYEAMRQAIGNLKVKPDLLLNDAVTIPEVVIPQVPIIKGDAKSVSIAAASIVAKVTRDRLWKSMIRYFRDMDSRPTKVMDQQNISKRFRRLDRHRSTEEVLSDTSYKNPSEQVEDQIQKAIGE